MLDKEQETLLGQLEQAQAKMQAEKAKQIQEKEETIKTQLEFMKKYLQSNNIATQNTIPNSYYGYGNTCPCCGYCRHCGRGGKYSYPYYNDYPKIWCNTLGGIGNDSVGYKTTC